jgi:hypothetical protein
MTTYLSIGSTITGFLVKTLPVLQVVALVVGIVAGSISIYKYIKEKREE